MKKKYFFAVSIIGFFWMENIMALELLSPVFQQGEKLSSIYTCDGKDVSPPLFWKDPPQKTKSFVLIVDDPDAPAGTWDHWILYNIPGQVTSLAEGLEVLPENILIGKNSWGKLNYGGPCPPDGEHRYFFKLYAIDILLPDQAGMTKNEIEKAMNGHIIASTELVAKYQRFK